MPFDPLKPNEFSVNRIRADTVTGSSGLSAASLTAIGADSSGKTANKWTIYFPAMPEQIELARTATYSIQSTPNHPDGIAAFNKTEPLEVPLSFKVHAFDSDYCERGPLSLLDMAAKMQSLLISDFDTKGFAFGGQSPFPTAKTGLSDQALSLAKANAETIGVVKTNVGDIEVTPFAWPDAVVVRIIGTGLDTPGIQFNGFLKACRVTLMGPWLKGSGGQFNLPSAAQFSFTVVHNPAYTGTISGITNIGGMPSRVIANRLYNTTISPLLSTDVNGNIIELKGGTLTSSATQIKTLSPT